MSGGNLPEDSGVKSSHVMSMPESRARAKTVHRASLGPTKVDGQPVFTISTLRSTSE